MREGGDVNGETDRSAAERAVTAGEDGVNVDRSDRGYGFWMVSLNETAIGEMYTEEMVGSVGGV